MLAVSLEGWRRPKESISLSKSIKESSCVLPNLKLPRPIARLVIRSSTQPKKNWRVVTNGIKSVSNAVKNFKIRELFFRKTEIFVYL